MAISVTTILSTDSVKDSRTTINDNYTTIVTQVNLNITAIAARLVAANNLSDLADVSTARTNLGLGDSAVLDVGTGAGTVCAGDDSRLSDDRDPNSHASTHASGGADEIKLDDLGVPDDNTDLDATDAKHGLLPKLSGNVTEFLSGGGTWGTPAGAGDMSKSVYDPGSVEDDAFDMDNMSQGSTNKFLSSAELTVVQNTSGTNTGDEPDATDSVKGIVELAVVSEVNTGTSTILAITPDALAGSNAGIRYVTISPIANDADWSVADGKFYWPVPPALNGMNLVYVSAIDITAGVTGSSTVDIYNVTDSVDMLSTPINIDSEENYSWDATTQPVIDTDHDDVATNDVLRIDISSISTTAPKGLVLTLGFQLP